MDFIEKLLVGEVLDLAQHEHLPCQQAGFLPFDIEHVSWLTFPAGCSGVPEWAQVPQRWVQSNLSGGHLVRPSIRFA